MPRSGRGSRGFESRRSEFKLPLRVDESLLLALDTVYRACADLMEACDVLRGDDLPREWTSFRDDLIKSYKVPEWTETHEARVRTILRDAWAGRDTASLKRHNISHRYWVTRRRLHQLVGPYLTRNMSPS